MFSVNLWPMLIFILMFVPMQEIVDPDPSTLWSTVWQFWYCIWNCNTAFEIGHWIYTHEQHRWSWLTKTVRHSWKGIYTNVNLLEIRTDLNWELNRYHYMTRRIKLWKLALGVDLVNNRQTGRLCAVDQTSYICLIICGAVTRISEVERKDKKNF